MFSSHDFCVQPHRPTPTDLLAALLLQAPGGCGQGGVQEFDTEQETRGGNHEEPGEEDMSLHQSCLHKQQKQCSQTFINIFDPFYLCFCDIEAMSKSK